MVDQVCSPTLDRNHEAAEYLLDKDCSAVVFGPPIPARLMKMRWVRASPRCGLTASSPPPGRVDQTSRTTDPAWGPFGTAQPIALLATGSRTGSASETASR